MFSLANVINAQYLLGEHAQELMSIVVHPRVDNSALDATNCRRPADLLQPCWVSVASSNLEWGGVAYHVQATPRSTFYERRPGDYASIRCCP